MPKKTQPDDTEAAEVDLPEPKPDPAEQYVEIPFRGVKFIIPRSRDDWSIEALAWLSEGKNNLFVKYTLEIAKQGQWEALMAMCPRRRDFSDFYGVFAKATNECVD